MNKSFKSHGFGAQSKLGGVPEEVQLQQSVWYGHQCTYQWRNHQALGGVGNGRNRESVGTVKGWKAEYGKEWMNPGDSGMHQPPIPIHSSLLSSVQYNYNGWCRSGETQYSSGGLPPREPNKWSFEENFWGALGWREEPLCDQKEASDTSEYCQYPSNHRGRQSYFCLPSIDRTKDNWNNGCWIHR